MFSTCRDSERRRAAGRRSLPGFSECVLRVKLSGLSLGSQKKLCPAEGPARLQPTAALTQTGVRVQIRLCSQLSGRSWGSPLQARRGKTPVVSSFIQGKAGSVHFVGYSEKSHTWQDQWADCKHQAMWYCRGVKHKALGQIFYTLKKHSCSKEKQSQQHLRCKCVKLQKMYFSVVKLSAVEADGEKVRTFLSVNCLLSFVYYSLLWWSVNGSTGGCSPQEKLSNLWKLKFGSPKCLHSFIFSKCRPDGCIGASAGPVLALGLMFDTHKAQSLSWITGTVKWTSAPAVEPSNGREEMFSDVSGWWSWNENG